MREQARASKTRDPMAGLLWADTFQSAQKRLKAKHEVHPDVDPAEGRADYVLVVPVTPKIEGVPSFVFAEFKRRQKLSKVEYRFPATKPARNTWAKKSVAERIAVVNAIVKSFGCTEQVDRKADYFGPRWKVGELLFTAFATVAYLEDYAEALDCNPSFPPSLVRIMVSR